MKMDIVNLPEEMETTEVRTILLGGGASGKISYLIEMEEDESDPEDFTVTMTLSNSPAVATQGEALEQHIELLTALLEALQEGRNGA